MISYSEFKLTDAQLEHAKQEKAAKAISKYIKENGVEPTSTDEYYALTDEELEQYKRVYYAIYLSGNGSSSSTGSTDSGSTSSSGGITYIDDFTNFQNRFDFFLIAGFLVSDSVTYSLTNTYVSTVLTALNALGLDITLDDLGLASDITLQKYLTQSMPYLKNLPERYCYTLRDDASTEIEELYHYLAYSNGFFVEEHNVVSNLTRKVHIFSYNQLRNYFSNAGLPMPNKRIAIFTAENDIVTEVKGYSEYINTYLNINNNDSITINFSCPVKYIGLIHDIETLAITLKMPTDISDYGNEITLIFKTDTDTAPNITFTAEDTTKIAWANGTAPTFEANTKYLIKMRATTIGSTSACYVICEYYTFS